MLGIMNSVIRTAIRIDDSRRPGAPAEGQAPARTPERRVRRAMRLAGLK